MEVIGIDSKLKEKGLTLLEALVATAIVGIGFIAVFQMVNYSVRSIDVSGERTKATYIVGTIAEDIYAFKNQEKGTAKFVDLIKDNQWKSDTCGGGTTPSYNQSNAYDNKIQKWNSRVSRDNIKCVDDQKDKKVLTMHQICQSGCSITKPQAHDKIYVGRMELNMQGGTKKKYLYFQVK